jgi:hypothetical protein
MVSLDWAKKHGCHIVSQHPGELLASRLPHSVSGTSIWQMAWNTVRPCDIPVIAAHEVAMAKHLQAHPGAVKQWKSAKAVRSVVLSNALMKAYKNSTTILVPYAAEQLRLAELVLIPGSCQHFITEWDCAHLDEWMVNN